MPEFKDYDIDKLFREAADSINPEFDQQSWEDMSSRLDRGERGSGTRSRTLYTLAILLLISSAWNGERNSQPSYIVKLETGNKRSDEKALGTDHYAPSHISADEPPSRVKDVTNRQRSMVKSVVSLNGLPGIQTVHIDKAGDVDGGDTHPLVSTASANEAKPDKADAAVVIEIVSDSMEELGNSFQDTAEPTAPLSSLKEDSIVVGTVPYTSLPVDSKHDEGEVISKKEALSRGKWSVKLPVSVDFSAIDYKGTGDPGINIGLLAEYCVTRHMSVTTGAIWSKKLYDLKNPDKSYGSGGNVSKASMLNGDCRILDIPINVTYYIFPERRTNLFVTIGSSSYIMLKEEYIYTVSRNQKEYQYTEEYSRENNDWFSILNVGLGIQQRISKHFNMQAEPFLKAPMKGVGEGKVNLMSTGMFLTLKYNF